MSVLESGSSSSHIATSQESCEVMKYDSTSDLRAGRLAHGRLDSSAMVQRDSRSENEDDVAFN